MGDGPEVEEMVCRVQGLVRLLGVLVLVEFGGTDGTALLNPTILAMIMARRVARTWAAAAAIWASVGFGWVAEVDRVGASGAIIMNRACCQVAS